ncbi:MAG: hypothetical protein WC011_03780 [Candidatus Paceibacterota bacterium]
MNKNIFLSVIIIIFAVVFYHSTTDAQVTPPLPTTGNGIPFKPLVSQRAQSTTILFGGKIQDTIATQVRNYESAGYDCEVPGSTIEIRPIKSSFTSYFIPLGTYSLTKYSVNQGQSILGISENTQNINCERCDEKGENCTEINFTLPIIIKFGNSRV